MTRALPIDALGTIIRIDGSALTDDAWAATQEVWADALATRSAATPADTVTAHGAIPVESMLASLSINVTLAALRCRAGEVLMLHAAGLATPDGRVVALVGPSGRGKTTVSRILGREFAYVSDESIAITADGAVVPYRKPLSVMRMMERSRPNGAHTNSGCCHSRMHHCAWRRSCFSTETTCRACRRSNRWISRRESPDSRSRRATWDGCPSRWERSRGMSMLSAGSTVSATPTPAPWGRASVSSPPLSGRPGSPGGPDSVPSRLVRQRMNTPGLRGLDTRAVRGGICHRAPLSAPPSARCPLLGRRPCCPPRSAPVVRDASPRPGWDRTDIVARHGTAGLHRRTCRSVTSSPRFAIGGGCSDGGQRTPRGTGEPGRHVPMQHTTTLGQQSSH